MGTLVAKGLNIAVKLFNHFWKKNCSRKKNADILLRKLTLYVYILKPHIFYFRAKFEVSLLILDILDMLPLFWPLFDIRLCEISELYLEPFQTFMTVLFANIKGYLLAEWSS